MIHIKSPRVRSQMVPAVPVILDTDIFVIPDSSDRLAIKGPGLIRNRISDQVRMPGVFQSVICTDFQAHFPRDFAGLSLDGCLVEGELLTLFHDDLPVNDHRTVVLAVCGVNKM